MAASRPRDYLTEFHLWNQPRWRSVGMSGRTMSDEYDGLDATEKAAVEAALNRCRALAAQIESKNPEHFVDKLSLRLLRLP
jgi:hypothetical protein